MSNLQKKIKEITQNLVHNLQFERVRDYLCKKLRIVCTENLHGYAQICIPTQQQRFINLFVYT